MKKYLIFILAILSLVTIACDDNETENVSRITYYANLKLKGGDVIVLKKGQAYTEPGYTATEGENDITKDVVVTGKIDSNTIGAQTISYAVKNKDGFEKKVERLVLITPTKTSSVDISGIYTGEREGAGKSSADACKITKLGEGTFLADDFFAGYYNLIRGYGASYRLKVYFVLNEDNTYTALNTSSPWGAWEILNSAYNPADGTLKHTNKQGGFAFNVTLTKQ